MAAPHSSHPLAACGGDPGAHGPGRVAVEGTDAAEVTRAATFLSSRCGSSAAGSGAGGSANASPSHAPFLVKATVPAGRQDHKGL